MVQEDDNLGEDLPPLPDPTGMTDSVSDGGQAQPLGVGGVEASLEAGDVDLPDDALPDDDGHSIDPGSDGDVEVVLPDDEPAIARPVDPFIGKSFGGYELVEPIGRGGMGMVYRGMQVSLQRSVAVKLLNKALVDNDEFIKRFQREARAMATIHHSNIVSVIDFGESDGVWYMVAEYVDGTNLAKMIRDKLMVPPEELVPIAIHCLSGLGYVAKSKVIHRDIKPDNILIDSDGVAKIADFGLAKDLSKEETDLTAAGSAMGTPAYMSPEQCMGHPLDGRSDIYSLGVTLYYALTGEKPFTGRSSFDIMTKQREYVPPLAHEINPRIPKEISALLAHMMEKLPGRRPADANECREAWLQTGQDLGFLGSITRSGEYLFPSDSTRQASVAYPEDQSDSVPSLAAPPSSGLDLPPELEPASLAQQPAAPPPSPPSPQALPPPSGPSMPAPAADPGTGKRRISTSQRRNADGTGRRTGADRRSVPPAPSGGSITCPRCGTLNRATRKRCEKCQHPFVEEESGEQGGIKDADQLFAQGRYREAATLYAMLADKETDRRQRSLLRTKERDARARMEGQRLEDVLTMVRQFEKQGKLKDAEKLLQKARVEGATTPSIMEQIDTDIERLQKLQSRGAKLKVLVVLVVLLGLLAGVGWVFREKLVPFIPALEQTLPDQSADDADAEPPVADDEAGG